MGLGLGLRFRLTDQLIHTIHHTNPCASIVEVFNPSETATQPLLHSLDITGPLKTASYTIYVPDEQTKETVESQIPPSSHAVRVQVHTNLEPGLANGKLDSGLANGNLGSDRDTFDFVITPDFSGSDEVDIPETATNLLKEGGYLFALVPEQDDKFNTPASNPDITWAQLNTGALLGHRTPAPKTNGTAPPTDPVIIILPTDPSATTTDLAQSLSALLQSAGYSVFFHTWNSSSDPTTFTNKACISLVEIDRPILPHLTESEFTLLQSLLLTAKKVLWVGGSPEIDPGYAVVSGLARVVRSEEPGIVFHTLHLGLGFSPDSESDKRQEDVSRVSELLEDVFTHPGGENEFCIHHGLVEVGRVVEDDGLNADLLHSLGEQDEEAEKATVQRVQLDQASSPLKLCVRTPGLLDTLCFEPDSLPDAPLGDDEVEIQVMATSLK